MALHELLLCLLMAARLQHTVNAHPDVEIASVDETKARTFREVTSDGIECALLRKVEKALKHFSHNGTVRYPVSTFFEDPKNLLVQTDSSVNTHASVVEYINFTRISGVSDSSLIVMDVRTLGDKCQQVYMHLYLHVRRLDLEGDYTQIVRRPDSNETRSGHFNWTPMVDVGFTSGVEFTRENATTAFFTMEEVRDEDGSEEIRQDDFARSGVSIGRQIREQFAPFFRHFVDQVVARMATGEEPRNGEGGEERGEGVAATEPRDRSGAQGEDPEGASPRLTLGEKVKIALQQVSKTAVPLPGHLVVADEKIHTRLYSTDGDGIRIKSSVDVVFSGLADSVVDAIHVEDLLGSDDEPEVRMHVFVTVPSLSVRGNCTQRPDKWMCEKCGISDCAPVRTEFGDHRLSDFGAPAVFRVHPDYHQLVTDVPALYRGQGLKIPAKDWRGADQDLAWVLDDPLRQLVKDIVARFGLSLHVEIGKVLRRDLP